MPDEQASRVGQSNISSSAFTGQPSFRLQEYSLMLANRHINELLEALQEGARTRPDQAQGTTATAAATAANEAQYLRVKAEIQRKIDSLCSTEIATAATGQVRMGLQQQQQAQRQAAAQLFHNHHHHQLQHNSRRESNTESTPAFFIPAGSAKPHQQQQQRHQPIGSNRSQSAQTAAKSQQKLKTAAKASVSKERQSAATCTGRSGVGCGDPSGDHHASKGAPDAGKQRQQHGGSGGIAPSSLVPPPPPPPPPLLPQAKKTVRYLDPDDSAKHCQLSALSANPPLVPVPRKLHSHLATTGAARPVDQLPAPTQPQPHRLTATETSAEVQRHQACPRVRHTYSSDEEDVDAEEDEDDEDPSTAPGTCSASVSLSSHGMATCSDLVTDSCDEGPPPLSGPRQCCISSQTTIAIGLGSGGQHDSADASAAGGGDRAPQQLSQISPAHARVPTDSSVTTATATNTDSSGNSSSESNDDGGAAVEGALSERWRHHPQFHLSAALWGSQQQEQNQQSARRGDGGSSNSATAATASNTNTSSTGATWSQRGSGGSGRHPQTPSALLVMPRGAAALEMLPDAQQPSASASAPRIPTIRLRGYQRRTQQHRQLQHHQPQQQLRQQQQHQQRLRRCKRYRVGSQARLSVCGAACTNASTQTCTYLPCDSFTTRRAKPPRPVTSSSSSSHRRRQPRKLNCQSACYMAAVCDPDSLAMGSETLSCCCSWHASRRRVRDTATSALVLKHGEAFNSVTVGPLAHCQVSATLVAASRLHSVELNQASQLPSEAWLDRQQQACLATHQVPTAASKLCCRPSAPLLALRHHRVDCRLHERLSATALLFATDDYDDDDRCGGGRSIGRRRGASALLTRLFYPEELHLLTGASGAPASVDDADADADLAAGDLQLLKVEAADWSVVAPATPKATVAVARTRVAAAAVRVIAAAAAGAASANEPEVSWRSGGSNDSDSTSGDDDWYGDSDGDSFSDY